MSKFLAPVSSIMSATVAIGRNRAFALLAVYRFGVWRMTIRSKWVRAPLSILYRTMFRYVRNHYGIELPYSARLGKGVIIDIKAESSSTETRKLGTDASSAKVLRSAIVASINRTMLRILEKG